MNFFYKSKPLNCCYEENEVRQNMSPAICPTFICRSLVYTSESFDQLIGFIRVNKVIIIMKCCKQFREFHSISVNLQC